MELARPAFIMTTIKPSVSSLCNGPETMARPISFSIPLCMSAFLPTFAPLLYVGGRTQAPIHTIHHKSLLRSSGWIEPTRTFVATAVLVALYTDLACKTRHDIGPVSSHHQQANKQTLSDLQFVWSYNC